MKRFIRSLPLAAAYTLMLLALSVAPVVAAPTITFNSRPYSAPATAATGAVNTAYSYDADATASDGSAVQYSIRYGPSGLSVDATTGVVSWTPASRGIHLIEIRAALTSDPSVYTKQAWAILVAQCNGNAVISGNVLDQNGNPVNAGTITARAVGRSNSPLAHVSGSISNGAYSLVVDSGAYVLHAAGNFTEQWHDGAYDFSSATALNASCGQTVTANFNVQSLPPQKDVSISGRVVSAEDNLPRGADIWFFEYKRGLPENLKWERMQHSFVTTTDANGYYSINAASSRSTYMVGLWVHEQSWSDVTDTYRQFSGLGASPADAEFLTLDQNRTDVNFLAYSEKHRAARIRGSITDSAGNGQGAWLSALYLDHDAEGNVQVNPMRSRSQRTSGSMVWLAIDSGEHVLMVIPTNHHNAPGYYTSNGTLTSDWHQAMRITPDSTKDPVNPQIPRSFNIRLQRTDSAGISQLRGSVMQSSNGTSKHGSQLLGLAPLANALVTALDSAGQISAWGYSDAKGNYMLENLGSGEYTIVASKIGYTTQTMKASTSGMGEIIKADMNLQQNFTSSVPVAARTGKRAASAKAWPNPTASNVTLEFEGKQGTVTVAIANAVGEEVLTREMSTTPGMNRITLGVENLPSGSYIATISSETNIATAPFTVVR